MQNSAVGKQSYLSGLKLRFGWPQSYSVRDKNFEKKTQRIIFEFLTEVMKIPSEKMQKTIPGTPKILHIARIFIKTVCPQSNMLSLRR